MHVHPSYLAVLYCATLTPQIGAALVVKTCSRAYRLHDCKSRLNMAIVIEQQKERLP